MTTKLHLILANNRRLKCVGNILSQCIGDYMNYLKIDKTSINNGPGVRTVLWVSGCTIRCEGCQNPESWDFNSGKLFDETAKQELFESLDKPYIQGLTISGGHPLEQQNIRACFELCIDIKYKYPEKDIWLYTGFTLGYEDFIIQTGENRNGLLARMLRICDVIVDGPYIEDQRNITLAFMGSENQRLIDVKDTLKQGQIVQYKIN